MQNKLPKAIVFDWDNTLVEGWSKIQFALNSVFRHFNLPEWDIETVAANAHRSARDSFPEKFGENAEEALKIFYNSYKKCQIIPEALDQSEEMLKLVNDMNIYSAILSNKNGDLLRTEVAEKKWGQYFSEIIGATDCDEDKPSIIPMQKALSGVDRFEPKDIWFVGDTKVDVEMARNYGCVSVVYGENKDLDHDIYFKNHNQLQSYLKNCKQ